jgi:hypothetical protein
MQSLQTQSALLTHALAGIQGADPRWIKAEVGLYGGNSEFGIQV